MNINILRKEVNMKVDKKSCKDKSKNKVLEVENCNNQGQVKKDINNRDVDIDMDSNNDELKSGFLPKNMKDWISLIASIFGVIAVILFTCNSVFNYISAVKASSFYKLPISLFTNDKFMGYYLSTVFRIVKISVLFSNILVGMIMKKRGFKISVAIYWSIVVGANIIAAYSYDIVNFLYNLIKSEQSLPYFILLILLLATLSALNYFVIQFICNDGKNYKKNRRGNFKRRFNKRKSKINKKIKIFFGNLNFTRGVFYLYFIIVTAIFAYSFMSPSKPNDDPKNIRAYEILKNEKEYNVIIGYKDGMAITITGIELVKDGNRSLKFINNEHVLQDIKDKVVVYKEYKEVIPFEGPGAITGSQGSYSKTVD